MVKSLFPALGLSLALSFSSSAHPTDFTIDNLLRFKDKFDQQKKFTLEEATMLITSFVPLQTVEWYVSLERKYPTLFIDAEDIILFEKTIRNEDLTYWELEQSAKEMEAWNRKCKVKEKYLEYIQGCWIPLRAEEEKYFGPKRISCLPAIDCYPRNLRKIQCHQLDVYEICRLLREYKKVY